MKKAYKIAIIDYQMSNMFSVRNALKLMGFESKIVSRRSEIIDSDGVILPGVGSYSEAMKNIRNLGLDESIKEFIDTGKPFAGICLGFQLLFDSSTEIELTEGLGVFAGEVKKFNNTDKKVIVPHVGWNSIRKNLDFKKSFVYSKDPLSTINSGDYFYFVHSYFVTPKDRSIINSTAHYGEHDFCSSVQRDNIFACQFHPEKSGLKGLQILSNMFN